MSATTTVMYKTFVGHSWFANQYKITCQIKKKKTRFITIKLKEK